MQIVKPPHKRYILSCLDDDTYTKYADVFVTSLNIHCNIK